MTDNLVYTDHRIVARHLVTGLYAAAFEIADARGVSLAEASRYVKRLALQLMDDEREIIR